MPVPAEHIAAMPRSGIREIMDLAWELGDVVHLEVGEPNFDTPSAHLRSGRRCGGGRRHAVHAQRRGGATARGARRQGA